MYLYILQHGEAEPKSVDPERPLSVAGFRDVEKIAARLQAMQVRPAYLFHSGKLRAHQSAQIVAEIIAPEVEPVQADGLGPNDDPAIIIEDIIRLNQDILIASHMPFVSLLCSDLLSGDPHSAFASVPGSVICLHSGPQGWQMEWMLRPGCL
jgi:phosphohistidine phosphatase